jgi:hypothetical protein
MKRIRYSEEQIIKTLQEVEAGAETREVCRQHTRYARAPSLSSRTT